MSTTLDFTPINEFFDHIYVITLERATQRQTRINEILSGLNYDFFIGSDKKDFTIDGLVEQGIYDEAKAIELHRYNKPMNTGQIGCSWSHRRVYEDMLKHGYKKVLILEDDAVPQKEGMEQVGQMLSELPDDWDLLYFDYEKNFRRNLGTFFKLLVYHIKAFFGKLKWSHKTIDNLYTRKFSEHLRCAGFHDYTSAYAITDTTAKKLIELQTPLAFVADNLLAHACSNKLVRGFVGIPKVFVQASQSEDKKLRESFVESAV
ncbi:glycosyltransferase family 25 protein [Segetibacter sp. 3557_3]|uniref:glycosyltransferase family 25 protein n=1 Tax=Segetibacter sp. 3557_3 TaxID=2547429 RepID=UPI0010588B79|nr:glycosyltransferase family 25 protein [Segetibacter sp. 3557_3]TDH26142.1 glycosyltransferase family 25 protein [Segetibacter sp. 3557_3]